MTLEPTTPAEAAEVPTNRKAIMTDTTKTVTRQGVSIAVAEQEKTSSGYSLPAALHAELQKAAKERGYSTSFLVQKALEDYLPRLIPVEELALVRPHGATATGTPS